MCEVFLGKTTFNKHFPIFFLLLVTPPFPPPCLFTQHDLLPDLNVVIGNTSRRAISLLPRSKFQIIRRGFKKSGFLFHRSPVPSGLTRFSLDSRPSTVSLFQPAHARRQFTGVRMFKGRIMSSEGRGGKTRIEFPQLRSSGTIPFFGQLSCLRANAGLSLSFSKV